MATFKLGAFITDIAGSVGGTTFRRGSNFRTIYNKQGTQIKSAFATASRKNQLGNIFASWYLLDEETKNQWAVNASLYPVKDKYGAEKFLTGRQLFTKLNAQLLPTNSISDVGKFDIFVENAEIVDITLNKNYESFHIGWGGSFDSQWVLISVYQVRKKGSVKPHAHFKRTYVQKVISNSGENIWVQFIKQFPFAKTGDTFGVNIQFANLSGVMSSVQAFTVTMVND